MNWIKYLRVRQFAHSLALAFLIVCLFLAQGVRGAEAHDAMAWSDPVRDKWFRSLRVPNSMVSCCDFRDGSAFDPEKVKQEADGSWWIDLGSGFVQVPPEKVVTAPISIDGQPYLFMMQPPRPLTVERIRCFVPPVGTY